MTANAVEDSGKKGDTGLKKEPPGSVLKQTLACMCVFSMSLSVGASSGFSGVAIPQLQDPDLAGFVMTKEQVSWFASLQTLAMIPTCVLGGWMGHVLGRRMSLLLIAPVFSAAFVCQALARDVVLLQFGRFLCGAAGGLACGPVAVYVSEVCTSSHRTSLGSGISGAYNVGMVFIFTLGAFCHWRVLAAVSAAFPLIGFAFMLAIPESPGWYITKGRPVEARRSLVWLRGSATKEDIENELEILQNSYGRHSNSDIAASSPSGCFSRMTSALKVFLRPDVWKPLAIILVVFLLQQFSGMSSISYYAVNVLIEAGSSVDEYVATIIFGLMRLCSQIGGGFLLLRFQRRHLLIISCVFVSAGMAMLATSAYFNAPSLTKSRGAIVNATSADSNFTTTTTAAPNYWFNTSSLSLDTSMADMTAEAEKTNSNSGILGALPLLSVVIVAITYHIGLGPIPWSYTAELFPLDVRSFMSGVSNMIGNMYIFMVVKTFPSLSSALTVAGTYWLYSSISLLTVLFAIFFLPETKDKRLDEITGEFNKQKGPADETEEEEDAARDSDAEEGLSMGQATVTATMQSRELERLRNGYEYNLLAMKRGSIDAP